MAGNDRNAGKRYGTIALIPVIVGVTVNLTHVLVERAVIRFVADAVGVIVTVAAVASPRSLYSTELASFTMGKEYTPSDATGFIRLFGLQMRGRGKPK